MTIPLLVVDCVSYIMYNRGLQSIITGIGFLPLIRELRGAHPRVTQPWYADDAEAGGKFPKIMEHFKDLQARGPARGYYLELTKSILVVAPVNVA